MKLKRLLVFSLLLSAYGNVVSAQEVDYSVTSVKKEEGLNFTKISVDADMVCMPEVRRSGDGISWWTGNVIDVQPETSRIAYLSARENMVNIYVKTPEKAGASILRTKRTEVINFSYSRDGKQIVFAEKNGNINRIFTTNADNGYICRQVVNDGLDFSPVFSQNMHDILFCRQESSGNMTIWNYNFQDKSISYITQGTCPMSFHNDSLILCARSTDDGRGEIWRVDGVSGNEECILSDSKHSFFSPRLSPDGQWILLVGSNSLDAGGGRTYLNTDIFVCREDGSELTQLTYHAADDLSPVWSTDGKYIYFVSKRGSATSTANIWRMNFNL